MYNRIYKIDGVAAVKKDELKSLVTQLYNDLMDNIDAQQTPNKEQIVEYLQDAALTIESLNEDELDTSEHTKTAFTNAYKVIAQQGIFSYQETNDAFLNLTQQQQENFSLYKDNALLDIDKLAVKFEEINSLMTKEVEKANDIISELQGRIKQLEENSQLDPLTKVFNRRALNSYLHEVCAKETLENDLYLVILDIDDFKTINDTHGHVAGDKILIFLTNLLKKTLRDGDKIFRYGGEEFVVILNRVDEEVSRYISERILKLVRINKLIYKGTTLQITISIGKTKFYNGDTPEELIDRADKALYRSKMNGKNQINMEKK